MTTTMTTTGAATAAAAAAAVTTEPTVGTIVNVEFLRSGGEITPPRPRRQLNALARNDDKDETVGPRWSRDQRLAAFHRATLRQHEVCDAHATVH